MLLQADAGANCLYRAFSSLLLATPLSPTLSPAGRGRTQQLKPNWPRLRLNDEGVVEQVAVTRLHAGEADFDELIGPHLEAGYRTALAILRNPHEAEDAVQDAAFKAWRRIRQLNEPGSARAWFLAIVANQCRSARRTRWWSVLRVPHVEGGQPEFDSDRTDIERALGRLPEEDRLALFLHFFLDLPVEEVGAVLGLSAAGAKTRVYRAAKKLRPDLEMM
ncbi:MAG: sigma-70 family RNA polymerase sigma factor [Chloroflexi bacterium]|nr:MAG: sigma-70 family RNA polymerase sigma factor [Chloroflexota bacterium]TME54687.1 MAG: sigma-70 family RNA polymerase sigma factor [Chloroflexota bacterium]